MMSLFINSSLTLSSEAVEQLTDITVVDDEENLVPAVPLNIGLRPIALTIKTKELVSSVLIDKICRLSSLTYDTQTVHVQSLLMTVEVVTVKCKQINMTSNVSAVLDMIDFGFIKTNKLIIQAESNYLSHDVNCGGYCLSKRLLSAKIEVVYDNVHNPYDPRSCSLESIAVNRLARRQSMFCVPFVPCVCVDDDLGFFSVQSSKSTFDSDGVKLMLIDAQRIRMFSHACLSMICVFAVNDTSRILYQ